MRQTVELRKWRGCSPALRKWRGCPSPIAEAKKMASVPISEAKKVTAKKAVLRVRVQLRKDGEGS